MQIFKVENLLNLEDKKREVTYRYVIGNIVGQRRVYVKEFDTYEEAREELNFLNGGCKGC